MKTETLQVELNKKEVIGLIKSICPSYSLINELTNQGFGKFIGGFVEKWEWTKNDKFWKKYSIEQLFDIYKNIKHAK